MARIPGRKQNKAVSDLNEVAERVYAGNLDKEAGAKALVRRVFETLAVDGYVDPGSGFAELESGLQERFPEVWGEGGEAILRRYQGE